MGKGPQGRGSIIFDHEGAPALTASTTGIAGGRWRDVLSKGFGPDGKRKRYNVSGRTKQDVIEALKKKSEELDAGLSTSRSYKVERAAYDWLEYGLPGQSQRTRGRFARLGTNPLAFGFPTAADPIVVDLATSAISGGELLRRALANEPLPAGRPTTIAQEALGGVLVPWGGHRGFGLAVAVQLLGVLCGMEPLPEDDDGWSFLIIALDPSLFGPRRSFDVRAARFADTIRATPPAEGFDEVRMPFDRSRAKRRSRETDGVVLSAATHARLTALARSGPC